MYQLWILGALDDQSRLTPLGKNMSEFPLDRLRSQLVDIMQSKKMKLRSVGNEWDNVLKCICSAYFYHAARLKGTAERACRAVCTRTRRCTR